MKVKFEFKHNNNIDKQKEFFNYKVKALICKLTGHKLEYLKLYDDLKHRKYKCVRCDSRVFLNPYAKEPKIPWWQYVITIILWIAFWTIP